MPYRNRSSANKSAIRPKSTKHRLGADPKQLKVFFDAISNGMSIESASHLADFRPRTIESWLTKGRAIAASGATPEPGSLESQHVRFLRSYEKARSGFEAQHVANINQHATAKKDGQWTASAWMLERRRPETYGITAAKDTYAINFFFEMIKAMDACMSLDARSEMWEAIGKVFGRESLKQYQKRGLIDDSFAETIPD